MGDAAKSRKPTVLYESALAKIVINDPEAYAKAMQECDLEASRREYDEASLQWAPIVFQRAADWCGRDDVSDQSRFGECMTDIPRTLAGFCEASRQLAFDSPPTLCGDPRWDALIAAVAEQMAESLGHPFPEWCNEEGRFCWNGWFHGEAYRDWKKAVHDMPAAFMRHGVIVDCSTLDFRAGQKHVWTPGAIPAQ